MIVSFNHSNKYKLVQPNVFKAGLVWLHANNMPLQHIVKLEKKENCSMTHFNSHGFIHVLYKRIKITAIYTHTNHPTDKPLEIGEPTSKRRHEDVTINLSS